MTKITNFYDPAFQRAFRAYFEEIGIALKPDTDVWDDIARSAREEGTECLASMEGGELAGFILYQEELMTSQSGFFTQRLGFIRELWVRPGCRGRGLGRALVSRVEAGFRAGGTGKLVLTYEASAIGFYEKLGFTAEPTVTAKNGRPVIGKSLISI